MVNIDEILAEAKRRYPIGTIYKDLRYPHQSSYIVRELVIEDQLIVNKGYGYIYEENKWAYIVSLPEGYKQEEIDLIYEIW